MIKIIDAAATGYDGCESDSLVLDFVIGQEYQYLESAVHAIQSRLDRGTPFTFVYTIDGRTYQYSRIPDEVYGERRQIEEI